jgi:enamine deaminase RidA (YjgF/YER057c/UK114 family)
LACQRPCAGGRHSPIVLPSSAAGLLVARRRPTYGRARNLEEHCSMSVRRIDAGPRMSAAVVHGNTVYLSGQVARDAAGKSVAEQTKDILATIDAILAKAGTDKSKLVNAFIWLTDIATFDEMNKVWEGWVSPGNTPARATVEAKLAAPQFKVEIGVIAAL